DPEPRAEARRDRRACTCRARGRRDCRLRPDLGHRARDAPLPRRARHRPRRAARARRAAAVRRPALRPGRQGGARARLDACPRDARRARGREAVSDDAYGAFRHGATPLHTVVARGRVRAMLTMLGPAFVASVAYVDPGNFATNIQAGARYGYLLLWVVLAANLMAMLIQYLSAKLGIVTDRNLPELCRDHYPRPVAWGLWIQAEAMAMATDIAEFLGAALGLNLLFDVPLLPAGLITGVIAFGLLELQRHGFRRFELAITALLGLVLAGFLYETLKIGPSASGAAQGLVPHLNGARSVYLAVGIIGATVMPHEIYLHSGLTKGRTPVRDEAERGR